HVEGVGDDDDDRQEQEQEDERRPDRQEVAGHDPSPIRSAKRRRSGSVASHSRPAATATDSMITRINSTAMADPSAQFCAVWNWLATTCPIMLPLAPPSTVAVM